MTKLILSLISTLPKQIQNLEYISVDGNQTVDKVFAEIKKHSLA